MAVEERTQTSHRLESADGDPRSTSTGSDVSVTRHECREAASTRYGHTNPEDAAEHIGFDLQPVAEA
jgi:hypothetical protein